MNVSNSFSYPLSDSFSRRIPRINQELHEGTSEMLPQDNPHGLPDFYETDLRMALWPSKRPLIGRARLSSLTYGYLTGGVRYIAEADLEAAFAEIDALRLRSTTR